MTDGPCQGRIRTSDEHKFPQRGRRRTADGNGTVRFKDEIGHRTNINSLKADGGGRRTKADEGRPARSGY